MNPFTALREKFDALDTDRIITEAFEETKDDLAQINRERMMDGVRSDGSIMPNYSKISQEVYGYPNEPIKLRATGAFQDKITIEIEGDVIKEDSSDEKSMMLKKRYGETIFGTGGEYKREYQQRSLGPRVREKITNFTNLKFSTS